jgi:putative toxin-antitoxin system antitoxin component (TIGR02293 family)
MRDLDRGPPPRPIGEKPFIWGKIANAPTQSPNRGGCLRLSVDIADTERGASGGLPFNATWHYTVCHIGKEEISVHADIMSALGGREIFGRGTGPIDLLEEVERGLPTKAYSVIAKALDLTPEEEDRLLQVSLRTRARWKQRVRLDPAISDRLVRLARILALAENVLESHENAVAWLREPSDAFFGRTPLELMTTDIGAEKVTNILYQMEYGIYA